MGNCHGDRARPVTVSSGDAEKNKPQSPPPPQAKTVDTPAVAQSPSTKGLERENDGMAYQLKKRRPGCNGMFWRQDPTSRFMLSAGDHWPHDDAILTGMPVTDQWGDDWLRTTAVRNVGDGKWHRAPLGSAIPMEHEDHYYLEVIAL
jgi:hypothetical protein